jgi:hypothetical protein
VVAAAFSPFAYGFIVSFLLAIATAVIGRSKGSSFFIWFLVGLVLPGIGLLAVILYRSERDEPERRCPNCGRVHKLYVQVCRYCGEDMYLPDPTDVRHPRAVREGRQRIIQSGERP